MRPSTGLLSIYYFHRFLGSNPFGFAGLDIKAFYMGKYGTRWGDTKSSKIAAALHVPEQRGSQRSA
jgi:ribonuclease T